jgi:hypothetical protein
MDHAEERPVIAKRAREEEPRINELEKLVEDAREKVRDLEDRLCMRLDDDATTPENIKKSAELKRAIADELIAAYDDLIAARSNLFRNKASKLGGKTYFPVDDGPCSGGLHSPRSGYTPDSSPKCSPRGTARSGSPAH